MTIPTNKLAKPEKKDEPKKLSKAGIWLRSDKPGIGEIIDMKAVLK